MAKSSLRQSAGILLFRRNGGAGFEVLLAHPGGPYWTKKDDHAWSIPKGEFDPQVEHPFEAAKREFNEETGGVVSVAATALPLTPLKQPSGKLVHVFAVEQDFDPATLTSNLFSLEWPPRSGRLQEYPEIDRAGWFSPDAARMKLLPGQLGFLTELEGSLNATRG